MTDDLPDIGDSHVKYRRGLAELRRQLGEARGRALDDAEAHMLCDGIEDVHIQIRNIDDARGPHKAREIDTWLMGVSKATAALLKLAEPESTATFSVLSNVFPVSELKALQEACDRELANRQGRKALAEEVARTGVAIVIRPSRDFVPTAPNLPKLFRDLTGKNAAIWREAKDGPPAYMTFAETAIWTLSAIDNRIKPLAPSSIERASRERSRKRLRSKG